MILKSYQNAISCAINSMEYQPLLKIQKDYAQAALKRLILITELKSDFSITNMRYTLNIILK